MKGITLRVARVRAGLRQQDVADRLGCSRERIAQVERMVRVSPDWATRYRQAVAQAADAPLNTEAALD